VLFFGLVFSVASPPGNFSVDTVGCRRTALSKFVEESIPSKQMLYVTFYLGWLFLKNRLFA